MCVCVCVCVWVGVCERVWSDTLSIGSITREFENFDHPRPQLTDCHGVVHVCACVTCGVCVGGG